MGISRSESGAWGGGGEEGVGGSENHDKPIDHKGEKRSENCC